MKVGKQLKLILVAGLALSLLSSVSVLAIAREDGTPVDPELGTDIRLMQAQSTATQATKTLQERLTERKTSLSTTLTNAQTTRLKARCEAAQAKLKTLSARSDTAVTARLNAYQVTSGKLQELSDKIDGKVDPATLLTLETIIKDLGDKITAFETDATAYKQTVADLVEVDCVADPTGFKASLEAAKTEQAEVKASAAAIRTFIQDTAKPHLQVIRSELTGGTN